MKKGNRSSYSKIAIILLVVGFALLFVASWVATKNVGIASVGGEILVPVLALVGGIMLIISIMLGQRE